MAASFFGFSLDNAFSDAAGLHIGCFSPDTVRTGLAVLIATLIELGSGLGLWLIMPAEASQKDEAAKPEKRKRELAKKAEVALAAATPPPEPETCIVEKCVIRRRNGHALASELRASFEAWCQANGLAPVNPTTAFSGLPGRWAAVLIRRGSVDAERRYRPGSEGRQNGRAVRVRTGKTYMAPCATRREQQHAQQKHQRSKMRAYSPPPICVAPPHRCCALLRRADAGVALPPRLPLPQSCLTLASRCCDCVSSAAKPHSKNFLKISGEERAAFLHGSAASRQLAA